MIKPLSHSERVRIFGHLSFKTAPSENNPEAVRVPPDWVRENLVEVHIPQLRLLKGPARITRGVTFHWKTARRVKELFAAWEAAGFLPEIETWNGSWVARFKRPSKPSTPAARKARAAALTEVDLSNHSWGTAFDVNAKEWRRGRQMPSTSAVWGMAEIAANFGFAAGAHFTTTPDPMHFEDALGEP